jgi:caa(3)-type oxidase subunit IV
MSAASRTAIVSVFLVLVVLTAAEIGVVYMPGVARGHLVAALVLLAVAKAGLVLLYFMHLGRETWPLKLTVLTPFALPAGYALALMADAVWRMAR